MAKRRVDYTIQQNLPTIVLLDDGTEIKIQPVVMGIVRTDDKLPDGQFRHEFNVQLLTDQLAPEGEIDVRKLAKDHKS